MITLGCVIGTIAGLSAAGIWFACRIMKEHDDLIIDIDIDREVNPF